MRVVSLTCSNTEIVCALGCAESLVGVDDHSDYPSEVVGRLPRVGPDLGIDIAKVKVLRPDLVLASLTVPGHEKIVESLKKAGLHFIAPEPVSLDDVYMDVVTIADRLGVVERGARLAQTMKDEIGIGHVVLSRPSLLLEWWPKPVIVPGKHSWVTDLMRAAGGENLMGKKNVKSVPVADEEARRMNPDAVIVCWCGVKPEKYRPDVVYKREGWREIKAVQNRKVFCIPEALLGRPGPRLVDGFREISKIVRELS